MMKLLLFISLFNFVFSGYLFNPENTSLSGASSIAFDDFRSMNPATMASHKGFTIKLLGASYGVGNNFYLYQTIMISMEQILKSQQHQNIFQNQSFIHFLMKGLD